MGEIKKEIQAEFKKEVEKVVKNLKDFFKPFEKLRESWDEDLTDLETQFDDSIEKLLNFEGMPKLKAKEKKDMEKEFRKKSVEYLKQNYPALVKKFEEQMLLTEGIAQYLDKIRERLGDFENDIDEIESDAEELENRRDNLSW